MLRIKYYQTNVKCALPFTDTFWYVPCSPSRSVCFVMRVCVFVCAYRCVVNLVHFQFQDSPRFIWIRFSLVEVSNCWFFLASIAWWIEWIRYVQKWDRIFFRTDVWQYSAILVELVCMHSSGFPFSILKLTNGILFHIK